MVLQNMASACLSIIKFGCGVACLLAFFYFCWPVFEKYSKKATSVSTSWKLGKHVNSINVKSRSGHCNIAISRGPRLDPRAWQEKEVPMNTLVFFKRFICGALLGVNIPHEDGPQPQINV